MTIKTGTTERASVASSPLKKGSANAGPKKAFLDYNNDVDRHAQRRLEILEKHPEVRSLYGPDPWVVVDAMARVVLFTAIAVNVQQFSWPVVLVLAYVVGGTISHSMALAVHEISHGLGVNSILGTKIAMMIANLPMGVPSAVTFQRYHRRHHDVLGVYGVDVDLPTLWEVDFFTTRPLKLVWLFLQPLFYSVRPLIVDPLPFTAWSLVNVVVALSYDLMLLQYGGVKAVVFTVAGTLMALGLHPMAGHFVAEHYNFDPLHETYSYYGSGNLWAYNVGFHNEHHDFRMISYRRLPLLRKLAPEFYENKPCHMSWTKVLYDYVMRDDMGGKRRVVDSKSYSSSQGSLQPAVTKVEERSESQLISTTVDDY